MQALELAIPTQQTELDLPEADDTEINDMAPVMRAAGNGIELAQMNFNFPPSGPRGGPVFNFRSEGRHFQDSNRCLMPASIFFSSVSSKSCRFRWKACVMRWLLDSGDYCHL